MANDTKKTLTWEESMRKFVELSKSVEQRQQEKLEAETRKTLSWEEIHRGTIALNKQIEMFRQKSDLVRKAAEKSKRDADNGPRKILVVPEWESASTMVAQMYLGYSLVSQSPGPALNELTMTFEKVDNNGKK